MRVVFAIHTYAPVRGGCETLVAGLSRGLAQGAHPVRVLTSNATSIEGFVDPGRPRLPPGPAESGGVEIERLPYRTGPKWLRGPADLLKEYFHRSRRAGFGVVKMHWFGPHLVGFEQALSRFQPDIVVGTALPFLHVLHAAKWARRHRRVFVVIPAIHPRDPWAFDNPRAEELLREADAVIAMTEGERDFLVAAGVESERIEVLGVGVDPPPNVPVDRPAAKRALGLPEARPCILFLGRKEPRKGLHELVTAHALLESRGVSTSLILAGPETSWSRRDLSLIVDRTGRELVYLLDEVDELRKELLLAAADIVALPSRLDSFGIVFLEAWIRGRPVVGARTAATSSLIEEGVDGLLTIPGDASSLASALGKLASDPVLAETYGAAGREKARTRYSWKHLVERFECRLSILTEVRQETTAAVSNSTTVRASLDSSKLSVVIVARNGGDDLVDAVGSAWSGTRPADEVIVLDNDSSDESTARALQRFPATRLVELPFNSGFAEGCNRGLRLATGDLVLLLNQDALLDTDAASRLMACSSHCPRAGVFALKVLVREEPRIVQSAGLVANQLLYACDRGYLELDEAAWNVSVPVLGGTGAALGIRRAALVEIGELDASLFMYYEDLDLCLRARLAGWDVLYVPEAAALHRQRKMPRDPRLDECVDHRNRLRVAAKNLPLPALVSMLPREALFQAGCLVRFARSKEWRRLALRLRGLAEASHTLPSAIAARRHVRVRDRASRDDLLPLLEPGWGYPSNAPPTPAFGDALPADHSLDFSPAGAASFGLGWWGPETDPREGWFRWTGKYALAFLHVPAQATMLELRVFCLLENSLETNLEGHKLGSASIPPNQWVNRTINLGPSAERPRASRLLLVAERTSVPAEVGSGSDPRRLGLAVAGIVCR